MRSTGSIGHEKSSSLYSTKGQKQEPNPNLTVSTILRNNPDTTSNPNVANGYFMLNLDGMLHGVCQNLACIQLLPILDIMELACSQNAILFATFC